MSLYCVKKYVEDDTQVLIKDLMNCVERIVLPDTVVELVNSDNMVCFDMSNSGQSCYMKYRDFAQWVFLSKGFNVQPILFGGSYMLLVSPNTDTKEVIDFLESFTYKIWNVGVYAICVEDYRNVLRILNIALRR